MSQQYVAAIVLLIGAVLKFFNIEIPSDALEAVIAGVLSIWIAVARYRKGDITLLGKKK